MKALAAAGATLALPVIAGRGRPLIMRAWSFGEPLATVQWGIREPLAAALEVAPDIVLTPLLTFDRAGHRVGYGAGYYDMTIAALRARKPVVAVGLAYAAQEVAAVPAYGPRRTARSRANRARNHRVPGSLTECGFCSSATSSGAADAQSCWNGCPVWSRDWRLDFVVINGENAAGGFGITEAIYRDLIDAGADVITLGNHAWDQREALGFHRARAAPDPSDQLILPARPARGAALIETRKRRARAGHQRHGPHLHGPARRSVRGGRA